MKGRVDLLQPRRVDVCYDYVMRAITALSGYVENGQRHQLIEKIRLSPPQEG